MIDDRLQRIRREMRFSLDTSVEHRSTGKGGHDGNGSAWTVAVIPEWQLKQWLDQIDALVVGGVAPAR